MQFWELVTRFQWIKPSFIFQCSFGFCRLEGERSRFNRTVGMWTSCDSTPSSMISFLVAELLDQRYSPMPPCFRGRESTFASKWHLVGSSMDCCKAAVPSPRCLVSVRCLRVSQKLVTHATGKICMVLQADGGGTSCSKSDLCLLSLLCKGSKPVPLVRLSNTVIRNTSFTETSSLRTSWSAWKTRWKLRTLAGQCMRLPLDVTHSVEPWTISRQRWLSTRSTTVTRLQYYILLHRTFQDNLNLNYTHL